MNLFEKLGWSKRQARPVGDQLETGRSEQESAAARRTNILIKLGLFLGLVGITLAAFPRGQMYEYTVEEGDVWRRPTLVAPFNFPVYKDPETVERQRQRARQETPPYFREVPNAEQQIAANRDTVAQELERIFDAYASFQYHKQRSQPEAASEDSLRYIELRRNARLKATPSQWRMLVQDYTRRMEGLSTSSRGTPSGPRLDQQMLSAAYELSIQLLSVGVINQSRDSIETDQIVVRNEEEQSQRLVSKDNLYGLNEAYSEYARPQLQDRFSGNPQQADLAYSFFRSIFQPSLRYLRATTLQERENRANQILPTQGGVQRGDIIVSQGEQVTPEIRRKLNSLERKRNERSARTIVWKQLSGELVLTLLIYSVFFLFVYFIRREEIFEQNKKLLLITILFAVIAALFGTTVRLEWASLYAVPVALAAVQLTIVFDARLALMGTLTMAILGGTILGLDLEFTLATFVAGMIGIYSVRDIKNRGQFFVTTLLVFAGYVAVLGSSWLYLGTPVERFGNDVMFAAIGASFTIASQFLLWILERSFDVTTDLTLLELSDTNRPLLKKLSLRAPGTFNHSLQVANLAEAAADRIGANALLTRVGALYHDIGKMLKPEYFVENQRGTNPHDQLKPRMSALIIASHVKEGIEMAKEYNLPRRVLHFIPTHHGTSRIEYFYRKAVEQTSEDDSRVLESEFRYPGPRPDSKETGILMMADSIEAASRSLDEPTHNRLKSLIDLIVREHIEDGQLDNTSLTFRDIAQIKDTFLSMLTGIYHVRVKYPDQDEETPDTEAVETIVEKGPESEHEGSSVVLDQNTWGTPEQSVSAEQLRKLPGVRDPKAPRAELAKASPYRRPPMREDEAPPEPSGDGSLSTPPVDEETTDEADEGSS